MDYIKLMRPKHYVKNFFSLVPLIFALKFTQIDALIKSGMVFLSLCFAASFVYIVNDIKDADKDRLHPVKRNRPIASGRVSAKNAAIFSVILLMISLLLSYVINIKTFIVVSSYIVLNILYTLSLKEIVIIDVMSIALGFILRIVAGACAIEVEVSNWLLLTAISISLFLGFGKRRHELLYVGENHRGVLRHYSVQYLDYLMVVSLTMTIMSYSLYTMDKSVMEKFGTDKLIYTVPFVIYGLFRYMYLVYKREEEADPTELVLKDKGIVITVLAWLVMVMFMIGGKVI